MKLKTLKTLKKTDNVVIIFGEWFDKTYGNTYYDAEVWIDGTMYTIALQYGYNAGDKQSIDEALQDIGFRVRRSKDVHQPYKHIVVRTYDKLKRDCFKTTGVVQ